MLKQAAALLAAILGVAVGAAVSEREFNDYLPIVDKFTAGDTAGGVSDCELIAENNLPAAATLYFIYSRGCCGQPADYKKAANWLNRLEGTALKDFELRTVWDAMRPPPLNGVNSVVIRNRWNHERKSVSTTFPLRGKYPLKDCYLERSANVGGICARVLMALSENGGAATSIKGKMRKKALELGAPDIFAMDNGESLTALAKAGYVPAALQLARNLRHNWKAAPEDIKTTFQCLATAKKICEECEQAGCEHARDDLAAVNEMLTVIPDLSQPTEELVKFLDDCRDMPAVSTAITGVVIERNDHVAAKYFQAISLTNKHETRAQGLKLMEEAAEAGYPPAIRTLYSYSDDPGQSWRYWYLAGKFDIPSTGHIADYYEKSFEVLKESEDAQTVTLKYKQALELLAGHSKKAAEEYERLFAGQTGMEERVSFKTRFPEFAEAKWNYDQAHKTVVIEVRNSDQDNYVDFFFQARPGPANCSISVRSDTIKDFWWRVKYADINARMDSHDSYLKLESPPERCRVYIPHGGGSGKITARFDI
ncbi:MAG: hypothetical protein PHI85_11210 [Victivallaceae bacterium]|nr:hypothetical protein [Victivallaceae bacterium]